MSEWISVKDERPNSSEPVLACNEYGRILIAKYDWFWDRWSETHHSVDVIYWMPLPKPPNR